MGSYPAVADAISTIKSNPYGERSIDLANNTYQSIVAPVIPYAQVPFEYIKPYVEKADEMADDGLTKFDKRFPIVKEDSDKIRSSILSLAFMPLRLAAESKDYVLQTYVSEYKKCGGDGYVASGKAMITTTLVMTSDSLAWLSSFLQQKKEQAKEVVKDKTNN